jgi:serine/threonine protein kinase
MNLYSKCNPLNNLLIFKKKVKKILEKKGYENIEIYNYNEWHHGYAYFTAKKKEKKFFIKIDFYFKLLTNDMLAFEIADKELKEYMIKIEDFIEVNNLCQIIIFEFLEGYRKVYENDIVEDENVLEKIFNIIYLLQKNNLIHRDIKLDNFLINALDDIKIIDFTFAISNKNLKFKDLKPSFRNLEVLEFLGDGLNPAPFEWNDCCSLKQILLNISKSRKFNNIDKYISFLEKMECETYKIKPPYKYLILKNFKKLIKNFLKFF